MFERVRGEEGTYVNPVLRLGKDSANYAQIVKAGSVQKIKTAIDSFKSAEADFDKQFNDLRSEMTGDIAARIEAGRALEMSEVMEFHQQEIQYKELVPAVDEFDDDDYVELEILSSFFLLLDKHRSFFGNFLANGDPADKLHSLVAIFPALQDVPSALKNLALNWPRFDLDRANDLLRLVREVEDMRRPVIGYLFQGAKLKRVSRDASQILGADVENIRACLTELSEIAKLPPRLSEILRGRALEDSGHKVLFGCLAGQLHMTAEDAKLLEAYLHLDHARLADFGLPVSIKDLLGADDTEQKKLRDYSDLCSWEDALADKFNEMPDFDYLKLKRDYEDFCAKRITNIIDGQVVEFVEQRKNDARTLRDIIKSKSKFPVDKFTSLKEAFPVMIAGLRDYANYVPLEQGLFNLVIIDEASQVSIAQALPAILRSDKIVLMGDRQQFSNVKASQASKALNNAYFEEVKEAFDGLEQELDSGLKTKLKNLDVTKSVMDFGEMTSQFMIMLRKHFRGYPEIISFSSEHFYGGALQVLKLRGKPIEDVLEFVIAEEPDRFEEIRNANAWEAGIILDRLEALLEMEEPPTVSVITPFREQQRYVSEQVASHPKALEMRDRLKLAIFTADTCQGEERELIFYSMVATREQDRLNYIFPLDLAAVTADDAEGKLKVQRLNVAFSRGQEKLVFLCSKPIDEFKGAARQVLQHYQHVLETARSLPSDEETDQNSPMEARVLEWLASTSFYAANQSSLEVIPQFPIGKYLKSIDPSYAHPPYKVDFLLRLAKADSIQQVIVEYDGFEFHFDKSARVDSSNWQYFLREADVEREAILESYGYKMIRINRFNIDDDPISTLDTRLREAFEVLESAESKHEFLKEVAAQEQSNLNGLRDGTHKKCSKCGQIKLTSEFKDASLKSGIGRTCKDCKSFSGSTPKYRRGRKKSYQRRSRW